MGKLLITSCLCLCFQSSLAVDHLASYWPLDQHAGDVASAGAIADNGSFVGVPSYGPGILGQAISLDGTNYISIPNSPDNDGKSETMTISVWCKTSAFTNRKQAIVAQGDSNDWRLTRTDEDNNVSFGGGGPQPIDTTSNNFNDNEWHHLVGVAHKGNPVRFYVDGLLIGSGGTSSLNQNSTRPTMIGSNPNVPSRSWNGQIDDVGIFHAPLNIHQIQAICSLAKSQNHHYALNDVNELFQIFDAGTGSSGTVKAALWSHVSGDPSDGRTFVQLADNGSGVAGEKGPDIFSFSADRVVIPSGFPVTLNWKVDPSATAILIDQGIGNVFDHTTVGEGALTLTPGPTTTTTYTLTATNIGGLQTTTELEIAVTDLPIIDRFTLSSLVIDPGSSVTIDWRVLNSTTATLNGVGISLSDTLTISPSVSGPYELTATNSFGSASKTLHLNVVQPGEPLLTEFLATNLKGITDEDGDHEDWIQITNPSSTETVISGNYFLTDDPANLTKWPLPDGAIAPGESMLVWASGKELPPSAFHANFSLKEEGEYLALVKFENGVQTTLSEFNDYPKQFGDVSYGLLSDLRTYNYFANPTPSLINSGETFAGFVQDTNFSIDRGFYDSAQSVEISTATPGAQIIYTIDSTTPSESNGIPYTAPIIISKTTTLRAIAIKDGLIPSDVDTQTYLFPAWTILQPKFPQPPLYVFEWPAGQIGEQKTDYRFQPPSTVGVTSAGMITALKAIPSISIVSDQGNLFDNNTGIYSRPQNRGRDWERPASMELILPPGYVSPDGITEGFQIDFGLRIRGGASRNPFNFKHGFRAFFRPEYGERALKFPLFGDEGTDEFRLIDLRTSQNYSWAFKTPGNGLNANEDNSTKNTFLRDVLVRDTQGAMGQPYTRSRYYHLYLNGLYWGLYMTQERPEAHFGDTYLGGSDEDFDTLKSAGNENDYQTEAADGNSSDWNKTYNLSIAVGNDAPTANTNYFALQGLNPSGERDVNLPVYLDIDNIINYHLLIFYSGSFDGPLSAFNTEFASNNWFALRNRSRASRGWTFLAHDVEHSLGVWPERTEDRTGPFFSPTLANQTNFERSNPQYMHQHLSNNLEYRTRFGDLAQRELFNQGVLTNDSMLDRIAKRREVVSQVIDAEAARWGDSYTASEATPLTRADWTAAADQLESWVVDRNLTVISQLRVDGLFPQLDAPIYNQHGGATASGFTITLSNPNASGDIYYTTDGTDPRLTGGTPSPSATVGSSLSLNGSITLMSRIRVSDTEWSALNKADFIVGSEPTPGALVISEINYHPADPTLAELDAGFTSDEDFEFVEIWNTSNDPIDLSEVSIANEIAFSFAGLTEPADRVLSANERIVIPRKPAAFSTRWPGVKFVGNYSGKLSNNSGTIDLIRGESTLLFSVTYRDDSGWTEAADGSGKTLVLRNPSLPDAPESWRSSLENNGNPGTTDGTQFSGIANDDDNRNGIPNLIEAVLIDQSGTYFDPIPSIESFDDGSGPKNFLTLTVKHYLPIDNATISVERSAALSESEWPSDQLALASSSTTEDGYVTAIYRTLVPLDENVRQFLRVRVKLHN